MSNLKDILYSARWASSTQKAKAAEIEITFALEKIGAEKSSRQVHIDVFHSAKKKEMTDHLYTARWASRNNKLDVAYREITSVLGLIGAEGPSAPKPAPPVQNIPPTEAQKKGLNIIPFATQMPSNQRMKTKGKYAKKYPSTLLVHFSAGRWKTLDHAKNMMIGGKNDGYVFLGCAYDGTLLQAHPVNEWGEHAGKSKKFLGSIPFVGTVSDETIGMEVLNPGILKERKDGNLISWFDEVYLRKECRYVTQKDWGCPTGWYLPFSKAQEDTIIRTALWLYDNDPYGVFNLNVVGHHEVSGVPGLGFWRKNDPGGALSMPMSDLRAKLLGMRGLA